MLWSVILLNTGSCWPLKIFSLIQIKAASICLPHQKKRSPYCLSRGVILRPFLQPLCGSLAQSLWAYCRDIRPGWHKSSRRQQFLLTQHRAEMDGAAWVCRTHPQSRTEKSLGFLAAERCCLFFLPPLQYSPKTTQQRCNTFESCIKTPMAVGGSRLHWSIKSTLKCRGPDQSNKTEMNRENCWCES